MCIRDSCWSNALVAIVAENICILSESKSTIESLKRPHPNDYVFCITGIRTLLIQLRSKGENIAFQLVSGHYGIAENERADEITKLSLKMKFHKCPYWSPRVVIAVVNQEDWLVGGREVYGEYIWRTQGDGFFIFNQLTKSQTLQKCPKRNHHLGQIIRQYFFRFNWDLSGLQLPKRRTPSSYCHGLHVHQCQERETESPYSWPWKLEDIPQKQVFMGSSSCGILWTLGHRHHHHHHQFWFKN